MENKIAVKVGPSPAMVTFQHGETVHRIDCLAKAPRPNQMFKFDDQVSITCEEIVPHKDFWGYKFLVTGSRFHGPFRPERRVQVVFSREDHSIELEWPDNREVVEGGTTSPYHYLQASEQQLRVNLVEVEREIASLIKRIEELLQQAQGTKALMSRLNQLD